MAIEEWRGPRFPDFVGDGIADQEAIMGAICAVKEAEFDGVKCVGVNPDATGEVSSPRAGVRGVFAARNGDQRRVSPRRSDSCRFIEVP